MSSGTHMTSRNIVRPLIGTGVVLLVPLIAMRYSNDVHWTPFDFIAAAVVLLAVGFACEFIIKYVRSTKRRVAAFVVVWAVLALVWVELAVGLFDTPFAGN